MRTLAHQSPLVLTTIAIFHSYHDTNPAKRKRKIKLYIEYRIHIAQLGATMAQWLSASTKPIEVSGFNPTPATAASLTDSVTCVADPR